MLVVPVLDLQGGQVVRGLAGRRHEYQPIRSSLTNSARPLDVARAFRTHFDLTTLYLADLDAIAGAAPAFPLYHELLADGFQLWIDAGLRQPDQAEPLLALPGVVAVAGLETLEHPGHLFLLLQRYGPERVIFSLDLKDGQSLGSLKWPTEPWEIANFAGLAGARRILVLDLAQVGSGAGPGTEALLRRIAKTYPTLERITGGGIRQRADLHRLHRLGVAAVLVASALHDGSLTRADLVSRHRGWRRWLPF